MLLVVEDLGYLRIKEGFVRVGWALVLVGWELGRTFFWSRE